MSNPIQSALNRRTLLKGAGATAAAVAAAPMLRHQPVAAQDAPVPGGTLPYGLNVEPRRMNQLNTTWMTDATQHIYSRLVTRDATGAYVPELAT